MNYHINLAFLLCSVITLVTGCPGTYPRTDENTQKVDELLKTTLKPVKIPGCTLKRVGHSGDGGYLMCEEQLENLKNGNAAIYSYGIEGRDDWGCQLASNLNLSLHQYDPFDTTVPTCNPLGAQFHAEGIANAQRVDNAGRKFDTIDAHIAANSDHGKTLIVKMDIEGAEWESLEAISDASLQNIQQLSMELHWLYDPTLYSKIETVLTKLATHFYVVHAHSCNYNCGLGGARFPSDVLEVTFLNKNAVPQPAVLETADLPHPLDARNSHWIRFMSTCDLNKEMFE